MTKSTLRSWVRLPAAAALMFNESLQRGDKAAISSQSTAPMRGWVLAVIFEIRCTTVFVSRRLGDRESCARR